MDEVPIEIRVNGAAATATVAPRLTLTDFLRERCGLTGTHIGCEHGVCGACTVLLDGEPVRACLIFAVQAEGRALRTVEGLSDNGELHPLQRQFLAHGGVQCGFCTPGMLISAKALLDQNPDPSEDEIRIALSGNLCRCTGYQGIVRAVQAAAAEMAGA